MFRKKTPPLDRRPEALEKFRRDITVAIAGAQHGAVGIRTIIAVLDEHADALRFNFVLTAPLGRAL